MDLKDMKPGERYEGYFWITDEDGVIETHFSEKGHVVRTNQLTKDFSDGEHITIQSNSKKVIVTLSMANKANSLDWMAITNKLLLKLGELKLLKISL